jgi:hypothetical protein
MPKEIKSVEEFEKISKEAIAYRIKPGKDMTKVKLRTKKYLYTFITDADTASKITSKLQIAKEEI